MLTVSSKIQSITRYAAGDDPSPKTLTWDNFQVFYDDGNKPTVIKSHYMPKEDFQRYAENFFYQQGCLYSRPNSAL